ncbi:cation:proton antiporter subunit C [Ectothiorhodospiraceae bacterium 2226]|nr:cation:proton antiporter subunit C [Ectothiorhodospiraceae bacterium 2226]
MLVGVALFSLGLHGLLAKAHLLHKVLGLNVMASGTFMVFIGAGARVPGVAPDPVPQAMVLTGIVVAVCTAAYALALTRRIRDVTGRTTLPGEHDTPPPPHRAARDY